MALDAELDAARAYYRVAELALELSASREALVDQDLLNPDQTDSTDNLIRRGAYELGDDRGLAAYGILREHRVAFSYYGEAFDPEVSNLSILTVGLGARPTPRLSADLIYHDYRQDEAADELRDAAIDAEPSGRSRELGSELDLVLGFEEIGDVRRAGPARGEAGIGPGSRARQGRGRELARQGGVEPERDPSRDREPVPAGGHERGRAGDRPAHPQGPEPQADRRAANAVGDFQIARGVCVNLSDAEERGECLDEGRSERQEARSLCREQRDARLELCDALGEDRYDPEFDPADFVDPLEIGGAVEPDPYFPLIPGTRWVYEGGDETVTLTVTEKTKLIEGVTCVVVNDLVEEDGAPIEDTDDWYAQDLDGNVRYCGEIARNFEFFEGDDLEEAELVDIDGSWEAGRDGAQPGIIMLASPKPGDVYRQEVALGEAEDAARVISTTGSPSSPRRRATATAW